MGYKILAINPGSTSTKVALYDEERPLLELNLRHSTEEISRFAGVNDQLDWRRGLILSALREEAFDIRNLSAVIGRGGLIRPIPAGVYEVNSRMRYDLRNAQMKHACNLGGLLAAQIAHMAGVKAYIADPPVVDEMDDAARISGMPMCPRKPVFHALNQKATARLHCERMGWVYEESNLIVAHMGGGISVAAHKQGRIVDVNNALDGDGPFAPDRAGSIPSSELIKVCFSGQYTKEELLKFISSKGGLVAYLGTNSVIQVMERIAQGDQRAEKGSRRHVLQHRETDRSHGRGPLGQRSDHRPHGRHHLQRACRGVHPRTLLVHRSDRGLSGRERTRSAGHQCAGGAPGRHHPQSLQITRILPGNERAASFRGAARSFRCGSNGSGKNNETPLRHSKAMLFQVSGSP